MTLEDAVSTVSNFLTSDELPHTGVGGFEGLVVSLLEAATGQLFRISGSGQQHGQDARSDDGVGNRIKVESKHYKKSGLDLRELCGEIDQATNLGPDLDLWVLAASCRVKDQDVAALKEAAFRHHIDILILDVGNDDLPKLPVLMAAHREYVSRWVERWLEKPADTARLQVALERLSQERSFAEAVHHIRTVLNGTLLGFEDARKRLRQSFDSILRDRGNCIARLNQDVALQADGVQKVDRHSISDQLVAWWGEDSSIRRTAVIGEEGTGKTWAVFDWVAGRLHESEAPLAVFFSASAENIQRNESIEELLPRLLFKLTRVGTESDWERRLWRWLRTANSKRPLLLIVADGLNENPGVDWVTFFRTLEHADWREKVAVIVSDRPNHWRVRCAKRGLTAFRELVVGGYTHSELEQVLRRRSVAVEDIPPQLMELIRKPRYCDLVCTHFNELKMHSDFTVERLIFLDARHRAEKSRGALTEVEFVTLITKLAHTFLSNPTIKFGEIRELLSMAGVDPNVHQEILDAGLLITRDSLGQKYSVARIPLVYGLGLLISDELRESAQSGADGVQVQETLERWFEPDRDMELKAEACGAALFHAYVEEHYPELPRRVLLQYWLGLRNAGIGSQESFIHYVRRHPEDFVAAAEEYWSGFRDVGHAQELISRAFISHRDAHNVQEVLVRATERWLGLINPEGHPAMRRDAQRDTHLRSEIQERASSSLEGGTVSICGRLLHIVYDDAQLRLARLALLIMSAGTRAPFVEGLVHWALASSVMGYSSDSRLVRWVVQLAPEPLEDLLLPKITALLETQEPTAIRAAQSLLGHLGTKAALELRDQHPADEPESIQRLKHEHQNDPCRSLFPWSDEDCVRCMERSDISPVRIVECLGNRVLDPDFKISSALIARLDTVLALSPEQYRAGGGQTVEEHCVDVVIPILASRSPGRLGDFFRAVVRTLSRRPLTAQYTMAFRMAEFSPLFTQREIDEVETFLEGVWRGLSDANTSTDTSLQSLLFIESQCFCALMPHLSPEERFEALMARSVSAWDLEELGLWFEPITESAIDRARHILHSPPNDATLVRLLWYLPSTNFEISAADRDRIEVLIRSGSEIVRGLSLRLVTLMKDSELARNFAASSYPAGPSEVSVVERWRRAMFISLAAVFDFQTLVKTLHPSDVSYVVQERGCQDSELKMFLNLLDAHLQRITSAPEPEGLALPSIVIGIQEPQFAADRIEFSLEDGRGKAGSLEDTWKEATVDPNLKAEMLNRQRAENVAAMVRAWESDAFVWYGRRLSHDVIRRMFEVAGDRVVAWIAPALGTGSVSLEAWRRLGSLLADVCAVLLDVKPALGLQLWNAMRNQDLDPLRLLADKLVFAARDSEEVRSARDTVLNNSYDDYALSQIAFLAHRYERRDWLLATIQRLISDELLWKRAKGLTLASLSDIAPDDFEQYVHRADVMETWVEASLPALRSYIRSNSLAKRWYKLFVDFQDRDSAWGAWQVFLQCADHRFKIWRGTPGFQLDPHKKRHECAVLRKARGKLLRKRERSQVLFGSNIEQGEIFPFLK